MRIYAMTATFGKLEKQTLTLEPGLNLIQAPNEWGKSTWCAFLLAMFYGLDPRGKSQKNPLPDKSRYAPWSGSSMAGRVDLQWQGRDITIERTTRGRIPMGIFRAYETDTGLPIPELTAENCGQKLLGVEGSVYARAGFIRFRDLTVTQDEALRRRLQALVTTGDDSGSADQLESRLKDLKNKVRHNRTGLLPQAEAQLAELERQLAERREQDRQTALLEQRLEELEAEEQALRLHLEHLDYRQAQAARQRVREAQTRLDQTLRRHEALEQAVAKLPPREKIEEKLQRLEGFSDRWSRLHRDLAGIPTGPEEPEFPAPYNVPEPMAMVTRDAEQWKSLEKTGGPALFLGAMAAALGAGVLCIADYLIYGAIVGALALSLLALALINRTRRERLGRAMEEKYGTREPERWENNLRSLQWSREERRKERSRLENQRRQLSAQLLSLERQKNALCGEQTPEAVAKIWREALARWEELEKTAQEITGRRQDLEALQAALPELKLPQGEDPLRYSREDTGNLLADARARRQHLAGRLGQLQGRGETLAREEALLPRLEEVKARITQLEDTEKALLIATEALAQSRLELQRRFAPVIVQEAKRLMRHFTGGRYERITLDQDFSLGLGAADEEGVASILWRSDGTMDQMYLALRLAVAQALTPQAPLVLDDALVRFDDVRLKAALELLGELSEDRQVLLFTCQDRERRLAGEGKMENAE